MVSPYTESLILINSISNESGKVIILNTESHSCLATISFLIE